MTGQATLREVIIRLGKAMDALEHAAAERLDRELDYSEAEAEVQVEAAECWFLGCKADGTHEVAGGDLAACDDHKIAGSKRIPQMPAVSTGEEGQVESTVEGGEPSPVAASGSAPRIPDFLPPSDPNDEADTDDLTAVSRVMRAWQRANDDAQIRQLTSR